MSATANKYNVRSKAIDHGEWYRSILTLSDTIDYSDIAGCYVLKPWAIKMWDIIKSDLDVSIQLLGIENYYFPLFVTKSNLAKEASHFDDFTPEVAWLQTSDFLSSDSHASSSQIIDSDTSDLIQKLKTACMAKGLDVHISGKAAERYAIRPTSETIIYPHFSNWIKATGKCPRINQWANVVRWENKATQPFIRSREFLWQEGHTCWLTKETALHEVYTVLEMYKRLYEDILAVPMIDGIKTASETFPGAELTTTVEGFIPDTGKGIQAATSHYLGEKFARIFNIKNVDGNYVHQNSWGLTTRSIGIMIMTHSDDRGLVLPPKIAPVQVVLVACGLNSKRSEEEKQAVNKILTDLETMLNSNSIRTVFDSQPNESPGMKFNKWEVKGTPLRIEFGPADILSDSILFVRRDKPPKIKDKLKLSTVLSGCSFIAEYLDTIQSEMYNKALINIQNSIVYCSDTLDFDRKLLFDTLRNKKLALIDWHSEENFETDLKELCRQNNITSTKVLCIPSSKALQQLNIDNSDQKQLVLFGRSY